MSTPAPALSRSDSGVLSIGSALRSVAFTRAFATVPALVCAADVASVSTTGFTVSGATTTPVSWVAHGFDLFDRFPA